MAETTEQLKARLENRLEEVVKEIEELNSRVSNAKKGAGINSTGDGVDLNHSQYKKDLYEELTQLRKDISDLEGPFIEPLEIY